MCAPGSDCSCLQVTEYSIIALKMSRKKDICSKNLLQNMCNWFWLTAHFPVIMNYLTDRTLSNYHQPNVVSWWEVCFRNPNPMLQCRFILVMRTCLSLESIYKGRQSIAAALLETGKKNNCHLFLYHRKKKIWYNSSARNALQCAAEWLYHSFRKIYTDIFLKQFHYSLQFSTQYQLWCNDTFSC